MNPLTELFDRQPWMSHEGRKCADTLTPDAWFPTDSRAERAVDRLCEGCPVKKPCLRYAIDNPELEGIWGGTTDQQRAQVRALRDGAVA